MTAPQARYASGAAARDRVGEDESSRPMHAGVDGHARRDQVMTSRITSPPDMCRTGRHDFRGGRGRRSGGPHQPPGHAGRLGPRLHELLYEYRPKLDTAGHSIYLAPALRHSGDAADVLAPLLAYQAVELFGILCLGVRHHVICWHLVARGWLDGAWVDPRLIFQAAFVANADTIILAHNHPAGDPLPSPPDMDLTRRMIKVGALLGVAVLDHIIIGDGAFASVRDTTSVSPAWDTSYATEGRAPAASPFAGDLVCTMGPLARPLPATLRRRRAPVSPAAGG